MATAIQKLKADPGNASLFPMFVKLQGRPVLVVGAGRVGEPKIRALLATGASIRVVALEASETVREWSRFRLIFLEERAFVAADLDGAFLAVIATSRHELNQLAYLHPQNPPLLCNIL